MEVGLDLYRNLQIKHTEMYDIILDIEYKRRIEAMERSAKDLRLFIQSLSSKRCPKCGRNPMIPEGFGTPQFPACLNCDFLKDLMFLPSELSSSQMDDYWFKSYKKKLDDLEVASLCKGVLD